MKPAERAPLPQGFAVELEGCAGPIERIACWRLRCWTGLHATPTRTSFALGEQERSKSRQARRNCRSGGCSFAIRCSTSSFPRPWTAILM